MRSKLPLLAVVALTGGLTMVAATQTWVNLLLVDGAAASGSLLVSGQDLNASLSPVAIAVLAAALALTIAGKIFRRVLGLLIAALGAGALAIAAGVLADPVGAAAGRLAEITAISGTAQQGLVESSALSVWPFVTAVAGGALVVLGLLVAIVSGGWRAAGRKYESRTDSEEPVRGETDTDRISDWERQSDGEDPSETDPSPMTSNT
ncbi:Trp biosynthesis-associated membrane protein [Leucobacter sp. W1153]|uniref:Trp biosynthesis-associated membrane protein n=1 Tax=unclassified Leucobacter TaxID=2621730 RepID=UPI003F300562